jgi:mannobiose 2-epimerase
MNNTRLLQKLCSEIHDELTENILNYWIEHTLDRTHGGFVGQISVDNIRNARADKSLVLNSRILWTFSAAFSHFQKDEYLMMAQRALNYLYEHFLDTRKGGMHWMLNYRGKPEIKKKQIYGQAFSIYALAEYFDATKDNQALDEAIQLFNLIENFSFDPEFDGYYDALSPNWKATTDTRLSDKDENALKTMNTHLHVLEAYTRLYQVWQDEHLKKQLTGLVRIHLDKIINPETGHFDLFFDREWNCSSEVFSYGHDIEGAWLMQLAVDALEDQQLIVPVREAANRLAATTLAEGIAEDGGVIYEGTPEKVINYERHWWPQAEGMVGFMDAYEATGEQKYLDAALGIWEFTKKHIINPTGEWYWRVDKNHEINPTDDKVGPWKAPYHNSRACFEILQRQKC